MHINVFALMKKKRDNGSDRINVEKFFVFFIVVPKMGDYCI